MSESSEQRHLRQALLRRLMTWSESDIHVLTEALEERLGREIRTRAERTVAPPLLNRQALYDELESLDARRDAALAEFDASMEQMRQMMPEPQAAEEEESEVATNRQVPEEESSMEERARNELLFTTERFRRLGSEFGGGRLQIYDEITEDFESNNSERIQYLMELARDRERAHRAQRQQEVEGEEGGEEDDVSTIEDVSESEDDSNGSEDTADEHDGDSEYYSQLNATTTQVMAEYEWYYHRAREMHEELNMSGPPPSSASVSELREKMEQLEEDMEHSRIDEGTYIERAGALRNAYLDAKRVHTRVVGTRIMAGPIRASSH